MKTYIAAAAILTAGITASFADSLATLPADSGTVTIYYKQAVYTPKEEKIGDINDVLVDKTGKVTAFIVGVGGFLGVGERDVAVPFSAVKMTKKNDKWWLTMNETKDSLKSAVGYKYDRNTTTWSIDKK